MERPILIVHQRTWLGTVPQIIIAGVLILLGYMLFRKQLGLWSLAIGIYVFLIYRLVVRWAFLGNFVRARRRMRYEEYEGAIQFYEKTFTFFSKYPWLDRFRHWILLTPSKMMIRATTLNNIVYCYIQLGDKAKVRATLDRFLQEFPDNPLANSTLQFINTWEQDD